MPRRKVLEALTGLLSSQEVVEMAALQEALGGVVPMTVFRWLRKVSYRSSYNHNGRYYTLYDPARFDRWGLWSHGDIHFSVDGTLKATVKRLTEESEAGYTQKELQELLRVRVQVFLHAWVRDEGLSREKVEGGAVEALRLLRVHGGRAGWSPAEILRAVSERQQALPRLDFVAEAKRCPACGDAVKAEKSRTRIVVTVAHGAFAAREVLKGCVGELGCQVIRSEALSRVVKAHQRYGYDLIVHVGLARYLRRMQREEIRLELRQEYGIEVSTGTVTNLCDRFLVHLEALHFKQAPKLREAMEGGYPLHLDAASERGTGGLFVCMDGWRRWVLLAGRIPTENSDALGPLIEKTVEEHVSQLRGSIPMVGKKVANPSPEEIILSYLDRYGDGLLGHPVLRDDDGRVIAVTERTNNLPEQAPRRLARAARHRTPPERRRGPASGGEEDQPLLQ